MQGQKGCCDLDMHSSLQGKTSNALVISLHLVSISTVIEQETALKLLQAPTNSPRK